MNRGLRGVHLTVPAARLQRFPDRLGTHRIADSSTAAELAGPWAERTGPHWRGRPASLHLNRPIDRLVAGCGLELTRIENYYAQGPKTFGYMFEGTATKP